MKIEFVFETASLLLTNIRVCTSRSCATSSNWHEDMNWFSAWLRACFPDQDRGGQMADSAGQMSSGVADADEYQSSYLKGSHIFVISDKSRAWAGPPVLTYEIIGLSNVVVPHSHLQCLFGEVCIFYIVTELLQRTEQQKVRAPVVPHNLYNYIKVHISSFPITHKMKPQLWEWMSWTLWIRVNSASLLLDVVFG